MSHRLHPLIRTSLLAVSLLAAFAVPGPSTTWAADETAPDAETRNVAVVKIEVKLESGKVIKHEGAVLDWGADGNIVLTQDDHKHDVALKIDRPGDSEKKIKLTVGYTRDGEAIIAPYTVDSQVKKREVIRIEGGVAIAVTVVPKTMKVEAPKEKPRDKIEGPGSNDPLDGLK